MILQGVTTRHAGGQLLGHRKAVTVPLTGEPALKLRRAGRALIQKRHPSGGVDEFVFAGGTQEFGLFLGAVVPNVVADEDVHRLTTQTGHGIAVRPVSL